MLHFDVLIQYVVTFFKMSAISVGCEEAYKTSVDVTCDSVDASIKVSTRQSTVCKLDES